MKLQVFDGGLSTRLKPHLIGINEAEQYTNIDGFDGTLKPVKKKSTSKLSLSQYAYYFEGSNEWVSSASNRDYVEYRSRLYYTEDSAVPKKYDGTNTYNLGITAPVAFEPTSKLDGPANRETKATKDFTTGDLLNDETYSYLAVNRSKTTGLASEPYSFSYTTPVGTSDKATRIEAIPQFTSILRVGSTTGTGTMVPTIVYEYKVYHKAKDGTMSGFVYFAIAPGGTNDAININTIVQLDNEAHIFRDYSGTYRRITSEDGLLHQANTAVDDEIEDISANESLIDFINTSPVSVELYRYYNGEPRLVNIMGFTSEADVFALDDTLDLSSAALFNLLDEANVDGVVTYVLTYYNSTDGSESAPSPVSAECTISYGVVYFAGTIPVSSDPQVDKKRLYRTGGGLSAFALVAEMDNADTSFTDDISNIAMVGTLLPTTGHAPALSGLKYLTESFSVLFAALGTKVYYTPVGIPDAWPADYFLDFDIDVTGISVITNGLVIFTRTEAYIVSGTNHETFTKFPHTGDQGCIEHKTIVKFKNTILWMSDEGMCTISGGLTKVVSKNKLGKQRLAVVSGALFDEVYYVQKTDGSILALDLRLAAIFKSYNLDTTDLRVGNDTLYGYDTNGYYELFVDSADEALTYLSPNFLEGSYTERKDYKDFYINSEGDLVITIFIDGVLIFTKTLSTKDVHNLKIPANKDSGYSLQLGITGTGTVNEIEYKAEGRKIGK